MLRQILLALGVLMLVTAAVCATLGVYVFLPHLLLFGLLLTLGIGYERWRYKAVTEKRADPRWQRTGERFVDPETGQLTEVWFDPRDGERHYLPVITR